MRRRRVLATVSAVASSALAGCSTDCDHPPDTPSAEEVLPDTAETPISEDDISSLASRLTSGADDGSRATWEGPDEEDYSMEILRYCNEESAEDSTLDDWDVFLAHDIFAFAVNGPDGRHAREVLAESPILTPEIVESKTADIDETEEDDESSEEDGLGPLEPRNVDIEARNGTFARPVISGELKNHTDEELELVEVVVRLYDDQENRFERKAVRTRELRAGGVWSWEAEFFGTDPERVGSYGVEAGIMMR